MNDAADKTKSANNLAANNKTSRVSTRVVAVALVCMAAIAAAVIHFGNHYGTVAIAAKLVQTAAVSNPLTAVAILVTIASVSLCCWIKSRKAEKVVQAAVPSAPAKPKEEPVVPPKTDPVVPDVGNDSNVSQDSNDSKRKLPRQRSMNGLRIINLDSPSPIAVKQKENTNSGTNSTDIDPATLASPGSLFNTNGEDDSLTQLDPKDFSHLNTPMPPPTPQVQQEQTPANTQNKKELFPEHLESHKK